MAKKTRRVYYRHHAGSHHEMMKWLSILVIAVLAIVLLLAFKQFYFYRDGIGWKKGYSSVTNANIVVFTPAENETVTFPYTVTGKARTFESNVQLRIEDENGTQLYNTFTTVDAPDMGEYGPFSIRLMGTETGVIGFSGAATIVVFETSAKDGSEINTVRIPLTVR